MAENTFPLKLIDNGEAVSDAIGEEHASVKKEARIVSFVPSVTELLFDLNLDAELVGRTGFCIHPKNKVKKLTKLGGTKNVNLAKVRELAPTHAVVNIDENNKSLYEDLKKFVPTVFVTHPLSPTDNIDLYRAMGALFNRTDIANKLVEEFQAAQADILAAKDYPLQRVLYLIWKDPWMCVNTETYISQMLGLINWSTIDDDSEQRYPSVHLEDYVGKVDRVLLSSEPYSFKSKHCDEVAEIFPKHVKVQLVDGEMLSWYGSRAIDGLRYLHQLTH